MKEDICPCCECDPCDCHGASSCVMIVCHRLGNVQVLVACSLALEFGITSKPSFLALEFGTTSRPFLLI